MRKIVMASIFAILSVPGLAAADSIDDDITALERLAAFSGEFSDGSTTDRERKCNQGFPPKTRSGLYSTWRSFPGDTVVYYDESSDEFDVQVHFTCRQKRQKKAGCGGWVEDTDWFDHAGSVSATVGISRRGKVIVKGTVGRAGAGRCGIALSSALRSRLDGVQL